MRGEVYLDDEWLCSLTDTTGISVGDEMEISGAAVRRMVISRRYIRIPPVRRQDGELPRDPFVVFRCDEI